jgi:hypothetical protein
MQLKGVGHGADNRDAALTMAEEETLQEERQAKDTKDGRATAQLLPM